MTAGRTERQKGQPSDRLNDEQGFFDAHDINTEVGQERDTSTPETIKRRLSERLGRIHASWVAVRSR